MAKENAPNLQGNPPKLRRKTTEPPNQIHYENGRLQASSCQATTRG